MASDADLVRNLEKANAGIKDATKNMASRIIQDSVHAVTDAITNILPRFEELAFGPEDGEQLPESVSKDGSIAVETPPPVGNSKVYLEDGVKGDVRSIAESLKEISTLMRKDKEDRARGSVPGSGR